MYNIIKEFNPLKIACKILKGKNKEYKPKFNSLKLEIDTMFALNETTERRLRCVNIVVDHLFLRT